MPVNWAAGIEANPDEALTLPALCLENWVPDCTQVRHGKKGPWRLRDQGRAIDVAPTAPTIVSDGEGMIAAACLDFGVCQVPDHMVKDEIARGEPVELPAAHPSERAPIHAVVPSGR